MARLIKKYFTVATNWICPPSITEVLLIGCGGGGVGIAGGNGNGAGSGGGGALQNSVYIPVTPGSTYQVIIGFSGTDTTGDTVFSLNGVVQAIFYGASSGIAGTQVVLNTNFTPGGAGFKGAPAQTSGSSVLSNTILANSQSPLVASSVLLGGGGNSVSIVNSASTGGAGSLNTVGDGVFIGGVGGTASAGGAGNSTGSGGGGGAGPQGNGGAGIATASPPSSTNALPNSGAGGGGGGFTTTQNFNPSTNGSGYLYCIYVI